MLSNSRCCLAVMRSALAAASTKISHCQASERIHKSLLTPPAMMQLRHKHETIFDNFFEAPSDKTKVYIDEVIKSFGDRGIRRNGEKVTYENMFKLFQLEDRFIIRESKLRTEWLKLQRALHPDKYLRVDSTSRVVSDQLSALVNDAYATMRHPYKRALYYMRLKANKSESEIENKLDKLNMEPEFLDSMMNLREHIENCQDSKKQYKLAQDLQIELDDIMLAVNRDFELEDYEAALHKLGRLKFVANCHIALTDKMESFSQF